MTASELILEIGKGFCDDFNISQDPQKKLYKDAYELFIKKGKSKGLLIIGSMGAGKSLMMRVYQKLFLGSPRGFKWVNSAILRDMLEEISVLEIKNDYGYAYKGDLYIDDIGLFQGKNMKFGNAINVVSEVIFERYELFVNEGFRTHFSSNLPLDIKDNPNNIPTIRALYGDRVYDRINEMCEVLLINSKSLRK